MSENERIAVGKIEKPAGKEKWMYFVGRDGTVYATMPNYLKKKAAKEADSEVTSGASDDLL